MHFRTNLNLFMFYLASLSLVKFVSQLGGFDVKNLHKQNASRILFNSFLVIETHDCVIIVQQKWDTQIESYNF